MWRPPKSDKGVAAHATPLPLLIIRDNLFYNEMVDEQGLFPTLGTLWPVIYREDVRGA